jgi:hypothetical protein
MADTASPQNEGSAETVAYAYKVFQIIRNLEKPETRKEILDLFAECILTVRSPQDRARR